MAAPATWSVWIFVGGTTGWFRIIDRVEWSAAEDVTALLSVEGSITRSDMTGAQLAERFYPQLAPRSIGRVDELNHPEGTEPPQ